MTFEDELELGLIREFERHFAAGDFENADTALDSRLFETGWFNATPCDCDKLSRIYQQSLLTTHFRNVVGHYESLKGLEELENLRDALDAETYEGTLSQMKTWMRLRPLVFSGKDLYQDLTIFSISSGPPPYDNPGGLQGRRLRVLQDLKNQESQLRVYRRTCEDFIPIHEEVLSILSGVEALPVNGDAAMTACVELQQRLVKVWGAVAACDPSLLGATDTPALHARLRPDFVFERGEEQERVLALLDSGQILARSGIKGADIVLVDKTGSTLLLENSEQIGFDGGIHWFTTRSGPRGVSNGRAVAVEASGRVNRVESDLLRELRSKGAVRFKLLSDGTLIAKLRGAQNVEGEALWLRASNQDAIARLTPSDYASLGIADQSSNPIKFYGDPIRSGDVGQCSGMPTALLPGREGRRVKLPSGKSIDERKDVTVIVGLTSGHWKPLAVVSGHGFSFADSEDDQIVLEHRIHKKRLRIPVSSQKLLRLDEQAVRERFFSHDEESSRGQGEGKASSGQRKQQLTTRSGEVIGGLNSRGVFVVDASGEKPLVEIGDYLGEEKREVKSIGRILLSDDGGYLLATVNFFGGPGKHDTTAYLVYSLKEEQ